MLHPAVLQILLDDEIVVINERLASMGVRAERDEQNVLVHAPQLGNERVLVLDAERYDGEPVGVSVADCAGITLPGTAWPPGLYGGEHPVLGRPFVCVRGTLDYHAHPSHTSDPWERYRGRLRLPELIAHLLRRIAA